MADETAPLEPTSEDQPSPLPGPVGKDPIEEIPAWAKKIQDDLAVLLHDREVRLAKARARFQKKEERGLIVEPPLPAEPAPLAAGSSSQAPPLETRTPPLWLRWPQHQGRKHPKRRRVLKLFGRRTTT